MHCTVNCNYPLSLSLSLSLSQFISTTKSIIHIANLILVMFLIAHWSGCIQFLVPYLEDFPHNSWVTINRLQVCRYVMCVLLNVCAISLSLSLSLRMRPCSLSTLGPCSKLALT